MGDTLHISRSLVDQMVAEARGSTHEVCGLLLCSRDGGSTACTPALVGIEEIDAIEACANVHPTPTTHFELDPRFLLAAHRAMRSGGVRIVGHYHSHPTGSPIPSATDAAAAPPDGAIWLIVANNRVRAWRAVRDGAVQGRFDPVDLIVTPPCA